MAVTTRAVTPTEIIETDHAVVACDGGGGALGHPKVYLNITASGEVDCPYCSRRYVMRPGAHIGGH